MPIRAIIGGSSSSGSSSVQTLEPGDTWDASRYTTAEVTITENDQYIDSPLGVRSGVFYTLRIITGAGGPFTPPIFGSAFDFAGNVQPPIGDEEGEKTVFFMKGTPIGTLEVISTATYPKDLARVIGTNNNSLPRAVDSAVSAYVFNHWTKHVVGPAGLKDVKTHWVNGYLTAGVENNGPFDFELRCSIYFNGEFFPGYAVGSSPSEDARDLYMPKEWGYGEFYHPGLYLPPYAEIFVPNREVAVNGPGMYTPLINSSCRSARMDGRITGNDPNVDYTTGQGLAYGAKGGVPWINAQGGVEYVPIEDGGENYTQAGVFGFLYKKEKPGQRGANIPGTGFTSTGTAVSGGKVTGVTVTSGGSAHVIGNEPLPLIAGSSTPGSGFGGTGSTYGPFAITGSPTVEVPNIIGIGDSYMSFWPTADSQGDQNASHGVIERCIVGNYGFLKFSVGGQSTSTWLAAYTRQMALLDRLEESGVVITDAILALVINDLRISTAPTIKATVQANQASIANMFRAKGCRIHIMDCPPQPTNANLNNPSLQVGFNSNFTAGGVAQQLNTELYAGTPARDSVIKISDAMRDPDYPIAMRTVGGVPLGSDGIHLGTVGTYWVVANMDVSGLPSSLPVLFDKTLRVNYETSTLLDVLAGDTELKNDINPDTLDLVDEPTLGTASVEAGKIRYIPDSGAGGKDTFSYTVANGAGNVASRPGIVMVDLSPYDRTGEMVHYNFSDLATLATSGVDIGRVRDLSGNGHHARQDPGTARPKTGGVVGSMGAAIFDGSDFLNIPDFAYGSYTALTVIMLMRHLSLAGDQTYAAHYSVSGSQRSWMMTKDSSNRLNFSQSVNGSSGVGNGETITDVEGALTTAPTVVAAVFAPAASKLYVDGDERTLLAPPTLMSLHNSTVSLTIGSRDAAGYLNAEVAEYWLFSGILSQARIAQIGTQAKAKRGL